MTLEEKAEEYVFSNPPSVVIDNHSYFLPSDLKRAYLAGAKELEQENNKLLDVINDQDVKIADKRKRIEELEKQIEKMKICQNCKFEDNDYMEEPCRSCSRCLGDIKRKGNSDKWELQE